MSFKASIYGMAQIINIFIVGKKEITPFGIVKYLTIPNMKFFASYFRIFDSGSNNIMLMDIDSTESLLCFISITAKTMASLVIITSISTDN